MAKSIKLNCDLGEGYGAWIMGNDEAVMPFIDLANIACGFHASDPDVMASTIQNAVKHGVKIGAHPGYDDKKGFGRRSIPHSKDELKNLLAYQIGALSTLCQLYDTEVEYIKPHGALYNDMMRDESVFRAIVEVISEAKLELPLMILAKVDNAKYQAIAHELGVGLLFEAFADRAYTAEGTLAPRHLSGAVHHTAELIINQAKQIIQKGSVTTLDGKELFLHADTICVHGDNQESINTVQQIRKVLEQCQ